MKETTKEKNYVSVIIPVFNLQNCIEDCLESVIHQTYRELQIILVDDGSADNSYDICKQYAQKDARILVEHQENRGVSAARNVGLQKATGYYVMFIDGDDTIAPDYIESYVSQAESTGADIVIGGLTKKEQGKEERITPLEGTYETKDFFALLCSEGTQIYGYVCCKLYRLSLLKENNIFFNVKMSSQEDLDFALSAYAMSKKISCFNNCDYYYEYAPATRKASAQSILGNQIKLFHLAESAGAETGTMIPRFQSMLYTWLYHANTIQDIKDIIDIGVPDALLKEVEGLRKEVQFVIGSFRAGKAKSIFNYFHARRQLRKVFVKLHLAKPMR